MLPKKIDRTKTYHKITNAKEIHHGLQYKTGLNIDPMPFNRDPEVSCCKGGIYFTSKEYIHEYFWVGCWIREITIPLNAQVISDPTRSKYRTDKIILGKKYSFNKYFDEWFDKETFPAGGYWYLAAHCSEYFNKWFDKKYFPTESKWYLPTYCSEYFEQWFDKKYFLGEQYWFLNKYCQKYKHIWE